MSSPPTTTLYILYNATSSLLGKLTYTYRKLTCPPDRSVCAACDITHGGLHLDETKAWAEAKKGLMREGEGGGVVVRQLHRDEVGGEVKAFVEREGLRYPLVLVEEGEGKLRVVMGKEELEGCGGDAGAFVERLREKGVVGASAAASL